MVYTRDKVWKDAMGETIKLNDRVMVNNHGLGARKIDVGRAGKVARFSRSRVVLVMTDDKSTLSVDPSTLGVRRRDGSDGFEGNRSRNEAALKAKERATVDTPIHTDPPAYLSVSDALAETEA